MIYCFQEAEGWPIYADTVEKRKKYIQKLYKDEGIQLDYDKVEKNPGKRALAKLMLNSFWGKVIIIFVKLNYNLYLLN